MTPGRKPYARRLCSTNGWDFESVFRFQYRIARKAAELPEWRKVRLGPWIVQHSPGLMRTRLVDDAGRPAGLVLGVAIGPDGPCLAGEATVPSDPGAVERWIADLAGRFVVLLARDGGELHLDPCGTLGAVYDASRAIVASSPPLVLEEAPEPPEGVSLEDVCDGRQRLLFGETCDRRLTRALPNHALSLRTFRSRRVWPGEDTRFADLALRPRLITAEAADRLRRNVLALVAAHHAALPITAGVDSRLLLAAALPALDDFAAFYCYAFNRPSEVDAHMALRLGAHLNLPVQVISRRSPRVAAALPQEFDVDARARMEAASGWCAEVRHDWARAVALSPRADIVLRGTIGELTRANKWSAEATKAAPDAARGLDALIGPPPDRPSRPERRRRADLLNRYASWMSGLPASAHPRLYDLAHVEHWIPATQAVGMGAHAADFILSPFNDRRIIHLAAAMPPQRRRGLHMPRGMIRRLSPSLLDFPFTKRFRDEVGRQRI